jgi:DNA (cytosine-5)-methyltransferase 1
MQNIQMMGNANESIVSGGGGSIRGAQMAGLEVIFGTDMDQICCETLRHNFASCEVYQMPVHEFATMQDPLRKLIVDILHTSFPCQPYSPLNTHRDGGKNFDQNIDAMLSAPELVKQTRPRIFTSENTFGILHSKSKKYFNKLVRMLIDLRFSVRWQIVLFQDFGLPQKRQRLIIIAAGYMTFPFKVETTG